MRLSRFLTSLFVVGSLCLLNACSDAKKAPAKDTTKTVEVMLVDRQPVKVTRIIPGSLEAIQTVNIFSEEEGRITRIHYYEGDTVEKDAVLLELDGSLIEAQLDKARATLNQAKLDLKRLSRLVPSQLASEDQLARAKTSVDQAQAESRLLQTRLDHMQIRAPFAGKISARLREPGDVVPTNSHILTLINPHVLKARLFVSEILLGRLQQDAQLSLRIDALGDTLYPARILRVHPTVDPQTRQGVVEVQLDPVPEGALPGQLCRLYLQTETSPLRTLPLAALRHDSEGEYVFSVDQQGKSRFTRVKTGLQLHDRVEILDGLEAGDKVIVKGIIGLRDGSKLKIADSGVPAQASPKPLAAPPITAPVNNPTTDKGP